MSSKHWFKLFSTVVILAMMLASLNVPQAAVAKAPTPNFQKPTPIPAVLPDDAELAKAPLHADGTISVMLELFNQPSAVVYAQALQGQGNSTQANTDARAAFDQIKNAQTILVAALQAHNLDASVLFSAQRAYNGVAITIQPGRVSELASLPGVKAVHVMLPKVLDNAESVPFINAPFAWDFGSTYRGAGIKVGVIDTGIDYLHTDFGGPGTVPAYAANNTTIVGDAPNFPGPKVAGGYDFAGDAYNADTGTAPAPDPDPMDCNGHGSHVSGTVAGYGVNSDGSTYRGSYGTGTAFTTLRIGPGVAPEARLYGLRVFGCAGSTNLVAAALDWAVDPNGDGIPDDHLDVVNMSLGSPYGAGTDPDSVASDNVTLAGVIVVASAGNSYDAHYVTGSPAASTSTISVASILGNLFYLGFKVNSPVGVAGIYKAILASSGGSIPLPPGITADLAVPAAGNDLGCNAHAAGYFTGKIALISRGTCSFYIKSSNAQAAGASAVILFNNTAGDLNATVAGTPPVTIPVIALSQADGVALRAAVLAGTVNGTMSSDIAFYPPTPTGDTVSAFSSRGPRRTDNFLKPDISAPGDSIVSVAALSGTGSANFSGTSMAAPHISGVMALLRQRHPDWTVEELKALVMNTATHNLTTLPGGAGVKFAPARVGAGRVDVKNAMLNSVVAYNFEDKGAVSVSFGSLEVPVDQSLDVYKKVEVENKSGLTGTFNVAFLQASALTSPGVTFTVEDAAGNPVTSLTVDPGEVNDKVLVVHLHADGALLKHVRDLTMSATQVGAIGTSLFNLPRDYMAEFGGFVTLTKAGNTVETVRLPVYAIARPVSAMAADTVATLPGTVGTATLSLSGTGINTGAAYPGDVQSLVTALELKGTSPKLTSLDPAFASADLQYVGVMSDASAWTMANASIYFGISTFANWNTPAPNDTVFFIYIDSNLDGKPDFRIRNYRGANSSALTDAFLSYGEVGSLVGGVWTPTGAWVDSFLNGVPATAFDTSTYNTNVMVLPVTAALIGLSSTNSKFNFWVETNQREWPTTNPVDTLGDAAHPMTFDAAHMPLDTINKSTTSPFGGSPIYEDMPGKAIDIAYNSANATPILKGLLLLHHHNGEGQRAQWVRIMPELTITPDKQKVGVGLQGTLDVAATVADYTYLLDDVLVDSKVTLFSANHRDLSGETIEGFAVIGGVEHSIGTLTLGDEQSSFWLSDFPLTPDRPPFNTQSNLTQNWRFKFIPTPAMGDDTITIVSQLVGAKAADFNTPANWVLSSPPGVAEVEILPGPELSAFGASKATYNVARPFTATITNPVGGADYSSAWLEFTFKNINATEIASFQVWTGSAWEDMSLAQSGPDVIAAGPALGFAVAPATNQTMQFKITFGLAGNTLVSKSIEMAVQLKYLGLTPHTLLATSDGTFNVGPNETFVPTVFK